MHIWLYTWLPRIFGCHQIGDRSFHYNRDGIERQFPICARCTGELIGILSSLVISFFYIPELWVLGVLILPMVIDGFVQLLTKYKSTNFRRVVTGTLFGYSIGALFVLVTIMAFQYGVSLGANLH